LDDALIVAGDVFDGINPSAESMQLLYETLLALRQCRPRLTTIMVAGNHDPAGRLEAPAALLRTIGVHVVGLIHRREGAIDLDSHLVPLHDGAGQVRAYALAIPFLRAADLPGLGQDEEELGSPVVRATRRLYAEAVAAARARIGTMPLLATGHLHCWGSHESEGAERRILVGGEHAVPHDVFPADLAYAALGHLHRPQQVGRETIRYSGSPFPLSATELSYEHGVSLVELHPDGTRCEHIRVARPVPCLRLPEVGALTLPRLADALATLGLDPNCPKEQQPFVHIVVEPDGPAAGLAGEVERIFEPHPVRCASVKIEIPLRVDGEAAMPDAVRLSDCDPAELFDRAFRAAHGVRPGPEHRGAFDEIRTGD
jgi:exonuclease SbcD